MNPFARPPSKLWRLARWAGLAAAAPALWACTSRTLDAPATTPSAVGTWTQAQKINNNLDLLFMIDDSSSMQSMQQKLLDQLPRFMNILEGLPVKPNLHVAVVSSDMGAKSDTNIMCSQTGGNQGQFFSQPEGSCLATTLTPGDTFISDVDGVSNFTDPIASVFQCIALLGSNGCGFEHQLASIDRALGADGLGPAPASNANFLRPDAYLGIVMLTNEDDCSAPADTTIYSLNAGAWSINNADGPLANYRCNGGPRGGHLCKDLNPGSTNMGYATPPLVPPSDAAGAPPMLQLSDCQDNESGSSALTPVSKFIQDIRALKPDPDNQIFVGEIIGPPVPYGVEWAPSGNPDLPNELWPQVMHSCGAVGSDGVNPDPHAQNATDQSFGDPGVREQQFAFGFSRSVVASICDPDYSQSMVQIADAIGKLITPPCINGQIQSDAQGNPACSVIETLTDSAGNKTSVAVPNCAENGNAAPCWTLEAGTNGCTGQSLKFNDSAADMMSASAYSTVSCSLCMPGVATPGC
ncbi:MAG TPA: hypothetical protein VKZ18_28015 [Polyangia bacterium]|nr:hypothetical protein [Polyangia bacterium]